MSRTSVSRIMIQRDDEYREIHLSATEKWSSECRQPSKSSFSHPRDSPLSLILIGEERDPAKVEDGNTKDEAESGHRRQLHIHNFFVLAVDLLHLRPCQVPGLNVGQILLWLLLLSEVSKVKRSGRGRDGVGGRLNGSEGITGMSSQQEEGTNGADGGEEASAGGHHVDWT